MIKAANNPFHCTPAIISPGSETSLPFATFKFVKKGFGNTGLPGESGDIYEGWYDNTHFSEHAVYDGSGALDNPASFEHKLITED